MAVFNGTDFIVLVDGVPVAHSQDFDLNITTDRPDATTKDSAGWTDYILGARSWSGTINGLFDFSASFNGVSVFDHINARTTATVRFTTEATGEEYFEGTASFDLTLTAPAEQPVTQSIPFFGKGVLAKAVNS